MKEESAPAAAEVKEEEVKPTQQQVSSEEKQTDDDVLNAELLSEVGIRSEPFQYADSITKIEPISVPNVPAEGLILQEKEEDTQPVESAPAAAEVKEEPVPAAEVKEEPAKEKSKRWRFWQLPKDDMYSRDCVGRLFL